MTDNEFFTLLYSKLKPLTDSITSNQAVLVNGYMTTAQGADNNPVVSYNVISTNRYGWQGVKYNHNNLDNDFDKKDTWILERVIQFNAMVKNSDLDSYTAFDILNNLAAYLNSENVIIDFKNSGINILRITQIRQVFDIDEFNQNIEIPSFDVTLSYNNETLDKVAEISAQNVTLDKI